jgi:hypothetical protein
MSFNAGICYKNLGNINGLVIGIVLKNLGPQSSYDGSGLNITSQSMPSYDRTGIEYYKIQATSEDLPTTLELGIGYQFSINAKNALRVNGVFQNSNYYYDEYRIGLEYAFDDFLFVRGGYILTPEVTDENAKQNLLAAGFGVKVGIGGNMNISIDYAFQQRKLFENSHTFGVTLTF